MDREIREAIVSKNRRILQQNLADDFLIVDDSGRTTSKSDFINRIVDSRGEEVPVLIDEENVRVYPNVAVFTYRMRLDGLIIADVIPKWRISRTFVKDGRKWRLVCSHESRMAPD